MAKYKDKRLNETVTSGGVTSYNDLTDKPTIPTALSSLSEDTTHRVVTDTEKTTWNAKSNLALGETISTAYRGDRGKTAYDHSQVAHAPSNADNTFIAISESTALDKSTVVGSEKIGVAATEVMNNITFDDLKAYFKDYFDTIYTPL